MDIIIFIYKEEGRSSQLHIGLYYRLSLERLCLCKWMKLHSDKGKTGKSENKKAKYRP